MILNLTFEEAKLKDKKKMNVGAIVLTIAVVLIAVMIIVGILWCTRERRGSIFRSAGSSNQFYGTNPSVQQYHTEQIYQVPQVTQVTQVTPQVTQVTPQVPQVYQVPVSQTWTGNGTGNTNRPYYYEENGVVQYHDQASFRQYFVNACIANRTPFYEDYLNNVAHNDMVAERERKYKEEKEKRKEQDRQVIEKERDRAEQNRRREHYENAVACGGEPDYHYYIDRDRYE